LLKRAGLTPAQEQFKRLTLPQAIDVFKRANSAREGAVRRSAAQQSDARTNRPQRLRKSPHSKGESMLITLIVVLIVVGVVLYLINNYMPDGSEDQTDPEHRGRDLRHSLASVQCSSRIHGAPPASVIFVPDIQPHAVESFWPTSVIGWLTFATLATAVGKTAMTGSRVGGSHSHRAGQHRSRG
jgi:hypothetical protein